MARGPLSFRQSDVERAIRAARKQRCPRVEIETAGGKIVVVVAEERATVAPAEPEANEWADADAAL